MLLYNLIMGQGQSKCSERVPERAHPQNSSTLSILITLLISSIHPWAAAPPGVAGSGVWGNAVMGVCGKLRPFVAGESNHSVHGE